VLQDPVTGLRIVAEIPDGTSQTSDVTRSKFTEARQTIDRLVGKPGMFKAVKPAVPPSIEITGLGFFDEPHMFTPEGMAPNCREIHPVLSVKPM